MIGSLSPSSTSSRLLALLILLLLIFILVLIFIAPAFDRLYIRHSDIVQDRVALGKYQSVNATRPRAINAYEQLAASVLMRGEFLTDQTASLAGANLRSRLRRISSAVGINISSVKSLPPEATDTATIVKIQVSASGSAKRIMTALHKLETSVPYLIIDEITIKTARVQRTVNEVDLDVNFTLHAYLNSNLK